MAKERLSKLQKWILSRLYAEMQGRPDTAEIRMPGLSAYTTLLNESAKVFGSYRTSLVTGKRFLEDSYRVTFSRSINSMWQKELIYAKCTDDLRREYAEEWGEKYRELAARQRYRISLVWLSAKGLMLISDINTKKAGGKPGT